MDFYIGVSIFGYILWNIFITESSDFSDEQFDIYVNCALYTPIPAFILAYFSGMMLLELEADAALFAVAVALAYMGPLFSYTLFCFCVKVKKLVTNKCKKDVKLEIPRSSQQLTYLEKYKELKREEYKDYLREAWKEYIKELSDEAKSNSISEIKEDLTEIKDTLKKMQEDIKLLENK